MQIITKCKYIKYCIKYLRNNKNTVSTRYILTSKIKHKTNSLQNKKSTYNLKITSLNANSLPKKWI